MDAANSGEAQTPRAWVIPSYPPIFVVESVETLRGRAEMPKRKSSQQAHVGGQGNLMLDAKLWVARSNRAGVVFFEYRGFARRRDEPGSDVMTQKDQFMSCPHCGQPISTYALVCPHCAQRISQKDFGKAIKENITTDKEENGPSEHLVSHSGTNVLMLLLILSCALGIFVKFRDRIVGFWQRAYPVAASLSPREFQEICEEGVPRIMYFEHEDAAQMHQNLEDFAHDHGFPNRASLLQTCAAQAYQSFNNKDISGWIMDPKGIIEGQ